MPQAPLLPPGMTDQNPAGATAGINPQNFLMAAADLHQQGAFSMPSGDKTDPLARVGKPPRRKLKVIK